MNLAKHNSVAQKELETQAWVQMSNEMYQILHHVIKD